MLNVAKESAAVHIGPNVTVNFQRTLRVPDDDHDYPLPPGLGAFTIWNAREYPKAPHQWRDEDASFIVMYQREAMWIGFGLSDWPPHALQVATGNIDALTGEHWQRALQSNPQNYVVVPDQPWLDGFNAGGGAVRQFVATRLGEGVTVEEQLSDANAEGGLRIRAVAPKPGRFGTKPPPPPLAMMAMPSEMGLGAGGRIRQKIYPDEHGIDSWDQANAGEFRLYIISPERFVDITGQPAPATPIDAAVYTKHGFPWFELYDEERESIGSTESLKRVKSIGDFDGGVDEPINIDPTQVTKLKHK